MHIQNAYAKFQLLQRTRDLHFHTYSILQHRNNLHCNIFADNLMTVSFLLMVDVELLIIEDCDIHLKVFILKVFFF